MWSFLLRGQAVSPLSTTGESLLLEDISSQCELTDGVICRPYFKVLNEILLGAVPEQLVEFSATVDKLIARARAIYTRFSATDHEWVCAVCQLCQRLGLSALLGEEVVARSREAWKDIAARGNKARK